MGEYLYLLYSWLKELENLNPDMSMMYMSDYGVPEFLFYPSLAVEFILPLIAGFKTKIVASLFGVFVLAVTLIFILIFQKYANDSVFEKFFYFGRIINYYIK